MQPDNEKIIEAIAAHEVTTRKLLQELINYGATVYTLDGIVETLKTLEVCYGQSQQPYMLGGLASGAMGFRRRFGDDSSDIPLDLQKILADTVKEYEAKQCSNEAGN